MGSIAEWIENCIHLFWDVRVGWPYVGSRDNQVLCKAAVTVYTNALCVLAVFLVTFQAVTAGTAGDVTLTGYDVANLEALNAGTNLYDFTDIFVTSGLTNSDSVLCPLVPLVDVNVGTADCGFMDFDLDVIGANLWNFDPFEGKSRSRVLFYKSPHFVVVHGNLPFDISDLVVMIPSSTFCTADKGYMSFSNAHSYCCVLVSDT